MQISPSDKAVLHRKYLQNTCLLCLLQIIKKCQHTYLICNVWIFVIVTVNKMSEISISQRKYIF